MPARSPLPETVIRPEAAERHEAPRYLRRCRRSTTDIRPEVAGQGVMSLSFPLPQTVVRPEVVERYGAPR